MRRGGSWAAPFHGRLSRAMLRSRAHLPVSRPIVYCGAFTVAGPFRPARGKGGLHCVARDLARGTSSGREVAVQEDDDGDIRVIATPEDTPGGSPIEIEPDAGESLRDALMTRGGFSAEEAATIESQRRVKHALAISRTAAAQAGVRLRPQGTRAQARSWR